LISKVSGVDSSYCIPDVVWDRIIALQSPSKRRRKKETGRPRMDDRKAMSAIFYILRKGCQWNPLPRCLGVSSTVHDRFQEWRQAGVFKRIWMDGLAMYDTKTGIDWKRQTMDGRRWVVERTNSWMNRFRRLLIRWEKRIENYVAMLHLACAWITYRRGGLFA
jgi:transposase